MLSRTTTMNRRSFHRVGLLILIIAAALWVPYVTHAAALPVGSLAATLARPSHLDAAPGVSTRADVSGTTVQSTCPYVPDGSYKLSCNTIRVTLFAKCQKADRSSWPNTTLDLTSLGNVDVENADGTLRVTGPSATPLDGYLPHGTYKQSCTFIRVDLTAQCQKLDGSWQSAFLSLAYLKNADVENVDGQLINR